MSFINTTLYSKVLRQNMHVDLFLPNDLYEKELKKARGIVYFLHGMGSSEKEFREYTAANRYARENKLCMVYVSAPKGFYTDMKYGFDYFTYITQELPQLLKSLYNLSFTRERTMVAGLSMGGYGALKIGLSRPDFFGNIAAFSGAVDMGMMLDYLKEYPDTEDIDNFYSVFGDDLKTSEKDDIYYLLKEVSKLEEDKQPRILVTCGKQDDLIDIHNQNLKLKDFAKTLPLKEFKYLEWNGDHDYIFWDRSMLYAVSFLLKNNYAKYNMKLWQSKEDEGENNQ